MPSIAVSFISVARGGVREAIEDIQDKLRYFYADLNNRTWKR
jgi:hypothetical protein